MDRRWLWIGACLLVGGAIIWGVGQAVNPASGDEEFQKALEAMKQVRSFRGTYIANASGTQHSERLWEVDCSRVIVHQQSEDLQASTDSPLEMKEDELLVGELRYNRDSDGSWQNAGHVGPLYSAKWYCDNLAQATVRDLLPDVRELLRHAMIGKGDKKTVNGVRCQDWKYAMKSSASGQQGSVCIGLDDHLPYEMIMEGGHFSYSDYNRPIQIEAPDGVLQSASSTDGAN